MLCCVGLCPSSLAEKSDFSKVSFLQSASSMNLLVFLSVEQKKAKDSGCLNLRPMWEHSRRLHNGF